PESVDGALRADGAAERARGADTQPLESAAVRLRGDPRDDSGRGNHLSSARASARRRGRGSNRVSESEGGLIVRPPTRLANREWEWRTMKSALRFACGESRRRSRRTKTSRCATTTQSTPSPEFLYRRRARG